MATAGSCSVLAGSGKSSYKDGSGLNAAFNSPMGVAIDQQGNVFVADSENHCIRKVTPQGVTTTVMGCGVAAYCEGNGIMAHLNRPMGIAFDSKGNLYIADHGNHCIRKLAPNGKSSTFAGSGKRGARDGQGAEAEFVNPVCVKTDPKGNVYVGDSVGLRKITREGVTTTIINGKFLDVAVAPDGSLFCVANENHTIQRVSPEGDLTILAGSGRKCLVDGRPEKACFSSPDGLAIDSVGNLYVCDTGNHCIRRVSPQGITTTLQTFIRNPEAVAIDIGGNLIVSDASKNRIWKIELPVHMTTLPSKPGGWEDIWGIAVDSNDDIYVLESRDALYKVTSKKVKTMWQGSSSKECDGFCVDSGVFIVADLHTAQLLQIKDGSVTALGPLPKHSEKVMVHDGCYYLPHKKGITKFTPDGSTYEHTRPIKGRLAMDPQGNYVIVNERGCWKLTQAGNLLFSTN